MKRLLTILASGAGLLACQVQADGCGAAAGATCKAAAAPAVKEAAVATINPSGLAALLKARTPVVVLDARSGKYDDGRRVPGAKSLTDKATADDTAKLIPAKDSLVVTYCANPKCPASARLAKHLHSLGYTNVVEMPEGIEGWVAEGRTVETAN